VVKFTNTSSAQITISGRIDCQSGPYRPIVFTSKDDDSIGETIPGSSGNPGANATNGFGLFISSAGNRLENLRVSYLHYGVTYNPTVGQLDMANVQFVKSRFPMKLQNDTAINVFNGLFYNSEILAQIPFAGTIRGQHWTVDGCTTFLQIPQSGTGYIYLTNSLIAALSSWGYTTPSLVSTPVYSSSNGVFTTIGAGGHYLVSGSADRNAGSLELGPSLLAQLAMKTTYPPLTHDNAFSVDEVLAPQAQRDSDLPDRGYHYDPIDWVIADRTVSANLILTNGVALAHYSSYGLHVDAGGKVISEGTPVNLNRILRYNSVQEQANSNWSQSGWWGGIVTMWSRSDLAIPEVRLRFTEVPAWAGNNHSFFANTPALFNFTDTQFRAGGSWISSSTASRSITLNATNCLFERIGQYIGPASSDPITVVYRNCLFVAGILNMYNSGTTSGSWGIYDTLFDTVSLYQNGYNIPNSNNGYISTSTLTPVASNNQTLAAAGYQSGPLGRYYLPNNSALLKAGSRLADAAALYHYTAQNEQGKLGSETVDIGFHYVSLDSPARDPMVKDKSLLIHWKLDDGSGTSATDSSGNGYTGTLNGSGVTWVNTTNIGKGLNFDGTADVTANGSAGTTLPGDLTVSCWMKKAVELSDWPRLVGKGGFSLRNYGLWIEPTYRRILFQQYGASGNVNLYSTTATDVGVWYHIAGVIRGGIAYLYINGNLESSDLVPGTPYTSTDLVTLAYSGAYTRYNGVLDDVRIYNRGLSGDEIASLYGMRGLVGHWKLNEGSGTSAGDSSGLGNAGTLSSGATWTGGIVGSNALNFNGGSSAVVTMPSSTPELDLTGDMTISCWAKKSVEVNGVWPRLVGKGNNGTRLPERSCFNDLNPAARIISTARPPRTPAFGITSSPGSREQRLPSTSTVISMQRLRLELL